MAGPSPAAATVTGPAAAAAAYKAAKEAFVANLNGTTVTEVQLVVSVALLAYLFWKASRKTYAAGWDGSQLFVFDFLVIVGPLLVAFTAPEYVWWINLCLGGAGAALLALQWAPAKRDDDGVRPDTALTPDQRATLVSLAEARKLMMLSTCLAILAVDFPIFPRRFAKTETWGTSLMDVGVGSFVFVNSLTAGSEIERSAQHQPFRRSLRSAIPLAMLGVSRLIAVRTSDYQEHVSEYGVHWNFFFTLACLPLLAALAHALVKRISRLFWIGLIVALGYQLALSQTSLQEFLLSDQRDNILSANKEGVFSVLGYFAIFAIGVRVGIMLLRRKTYGEWRVTVARLLTLDAILWALWWICETVFDIRTSRRLANLPYVLWTLAYNLPFLAGLLAIDLAVGFTRKGILYPGINRNMLFLFLVANILTGIVNMSIRTLYTSGPIAFTILTVYMIDLCLVAAVCHVYDWTLKFW